MTTDGHLLEADGVTHSPNCFPCKIQTISFAPSAMPTRSPGAARAKEKDPKLEKDLAAYKSLRRQGLQPMSTQGAHELMVQANEKWEVERNQIETNPVSRKRMAQVLAEMPAPSADPIVREDA